MYMIPMVLTNLNNNCMFSKDIIAIRKFERRWRNDSNLAAVDVVVVDVVFAVAAFFAHAIAITIIERKRVSMNRGRFQSAAD